MPTVAETIVAALADLGVRDIWGVVGDALNPVTDAIRREERLEWIGVRHEEAGAFAAGAQAQLTGTLGVCMGTVGPGSLHLLNGLYDAKKSHAPVLAICGQVPLAELGIDFFQEVHNDAVFADVAEFCRTRHEPAQLTALLEQAVHGAFARPGVAVLTIPGDVGGLDYLGHRRQVRHPARRQPRTRHALKRAATIDRRGRAGDAAGRHGRARRSQGDARPGRPPGRPDGADAQGQGGTRARQPLRRSGRAG